MKSLMGRKRAAIAASAVAVMVGLASLSLPAQRGGGIARTGGHPDLNGIWESMNTANWNLEAHSARGPWVSDLGAWGGERGGQSVVDGGTIPYTPAAAAKRKDNFDNRLKNDPESWCYLPGVPRMVYMPYPFQIVQTPQNILMASEYDATSRVISMDGKEPDAPVDTWMGYSWGHWEGDSLVVNTKGFNDRTWFDRAGNFHSEDLKVTEKFTPVSENVLTYSATMTDPKTFSRPWTITMPLYKHLEKNAQILEYNCVEMTEERRYSPLLKLTPPPPAPPAPAK